MPSADGPGEPERPDEGSLKALRDLVSSALSEPEPEDAALEAGKPFGGYVLIEELGRGGFGVVYRARHSGIHNVVALKLMRAADLATDREIRRFLAGAAAAAALDHPNIVPIYHVDERDGRPFFTMKLIEGGNLADALERGRPSQGEAAHWVAQVARAVDHAHDHGVLHRDLKPANILLDLDNVPHVADFGLARRLDEASEDDVSSEGAGAPYYMAPEQASGDPRKLTRRADIYGLGVIFYELLCGEVPYAGLPFGEWLQALQQADPVPRPSLRAPDLNRDLEKVCLKCLEKNPEHRYRSAALLATDLELVLSGNPPAGARGEILPVRALRWVRRQPLKAAAAAGALLVMAVLVTAAVSLWRAEEEQRQSVLETSSFIASSQAGAALYQLREFADRVERTARERSVRDLAASKAITEDPPVLRESAHGFQGLFVLTADGTLIAQSPPPAKPIYGKSFAFRDYFRGARVLSESGRPGAYVARAYRAESTGQLEFAISAPILDEHGTWLGALVASIGADPVFGRVRLRGSTASGRIVALIGPRDHDRANQDQPLPSDFYFVVHPKLGHGLELPLRELRPQLLRSAFGGTAAPGSQFLLHQAPPITVGDYRDPVSQSDGSWLAAFAPVGETGYVVVVQTPQEAALRSTRGLAQELSLRAFMPLSTGLALILLAAVLVTRKNRVLELPRAPRRARS